MVLVVADDYRDFGTKILTPLAKRIPIGPMGISFLSLLTAIGAGYSFYIADLENTNWLLWKNAPLHIFQLSSAEWLVECSEL